jgi:hypothetical protein
MDMGILITTEIIGQVIIMVTGTVTMTVITGEVDTIHIIMGITGQELMTIMELHTGEGPQDMVIIPRMKHPVMQPTGIAEQ